MGIAMHATARSQINLVMQAQEHVKQLQGVRDIIYPIFWFQVRFFDLFFLLPYYQWPLGE